MQDAMTTTETPEPIEIGSPESFLNRELNWLQFARRVLELVLDGEVPLLERVKFAGIVGMLHDEFFMKRISGLKRSIERRPDRPSIDGLRPGEALRACRQEILSQMDELAAVMQREIRPGLASAGVPILEWEELSAAQQQELHDVFLRSIFPILTPLAVDAEHPFPFISNLGLNLAVVLREPSRERFVRLKVPSNRPRWIALSQGGGFVPLEQVIAANLHELFPGVETYAYLFRVTRGARGESTRDNEDLGRLGPLEPGSIIAQVADELKARRFAGEVRLEVAADMPDEMRWWLAEQLNLGPDDLYVNGNLFALADLLQFEVADLDELRDPEHTPVPHYRLEHIGKNEPTRIFDEIRKGDIFLHHPYHSFESSVLRFIEAAAVDEAVLGIKLTIYRTSSNSPIVQALAEAARRGKQVAVLVEITARFDEAPNIAWGRLLENEGVHVTYGVEKLKTHVKLALVVREEGSSLRRYVHVGTGNYHTRTASAYEDLGLLSCDTDLTADAAAVFNELTSATPFDGYRKMLVAPRYMRSRFVELIRREATHAGEGRPAGVTAKMNQLQDPEIITELYRASQEGVPVTLNVRGLCCIRPGVPGLSENVRVYSHVGRFLEHGRLYRFENAGSPEYFIGSADWMRRNLDRRVETIAPVGDPQVQREIERILEVYEMDNHSAWDMQPDGTYVRRRPAPGESARPAQEMFIELARREGSAAVPDQGGVE
jgi:polyphosphate kinase